MRTADFSKRVRPFASVRWELPVCPGGRSSVRCFLTVQRKRIKRTDTGVQTEKERKKEKKKKKKKKKEKEKKKKKKMEKKKVR